MATVVCGALLEVNGSLTYEQAVSVRKQGAKALCQAAFRSV